MVKTRREFISLAVGSGIALQFSAPVFAAASQRKTQEKHAVPPVATVITQVFGDGIRATGLALYYPEPVNGAQLNIHDFTVTGRRITGVFTSESSDPARRSTRGRYVIVLLSPEDKNAPLARKVPDDGKNNAGSGPGGPGKAGSVPVTDTLYPAPSLTYQQTGTLPLANGHTVAPEQTPQHSTAVNNLIVDDFRQLEFHDPKTGRHLKYNLFVPAGYTAGRAWPLVLFMHDAGATSDVTRTTLYQGLGAVCWASPEDQAKRPCFVLAPQYDEIIADDDNQTSSMMETTINLIRHLSETYNIDSKRRYTTGQSGGCMMSIAMDIHYPGFFAASLLVAGQWDPAQVKPLASQKLWIVVSEDDAKAWPGENAIVAELEKYGAKITRAEWDGTWDAAQFRQAFNRMDTRHTPINYVTFRKGTVIPAGESTAGASGHRNTWRIAYTIEPLREWIFRQHL